MGRVLGNQPVVFIGLGDLELFMLANQQFSMYVLLSIVGRLLGVGELP
jgi:hypothetical protein